MCSLFPLGFLNAFDGSPLELLVVFLAILLLFGAKSLPDMMRTVGRWSEKLRQLSREVQREIVEAGEPVTEARRVWEQETKDLTVSSTERTPPPEPPADEV